MEQDKEKNLIPEEEAVETREVVAEDTPVRPLRRAVIEKYPDFASDDEDEWAAKEDEYFTEVYNYNKSYRDAEAQLDELIATDEELASVLNDMVVNKTPFRVSIAKFLSQDDLIPVEGEEDFETYQSAYAERLDRKAKRDAREAEIEANEVASLEAIDAFAVEHEMDDDQKNSFIEYINGIFDNMLYKRLSPEVLGAFYNAMNYDADVSAAAEAGEIKGRNAKIEADMVSEDADIEGDGLPVLDKGAGIEGEREPNEVDQFFGFQKRKRI